MYSKPSRENQRFAHDVFNGIAAWFKVRRLLMYVVKIQAMFFSYARNVTDSYPKLKINNEIINNADHTQFLSCIIDPHFLWDKHNNISIHISNGIAMLQTWHTFPMYVNHYLL